MGQTCNESSQSCSSTCTPTCSTAGESRCSGDQIIKCAQSALGCLEWSVEKTCGAGQICNAATTQCASDPCQGAPVAGRCLDARTIEYCAVSTGSGNPERKTYACRAGESCAVSDGAASCVLTSACRDGESQCVSARQLRECKGGAWTTTECAAECVSSALGSSCAATATTRSLNGTLTYDVRGPNESLTNWSATKFNAELSSILVLSLAGGEIIDAQTTGTKGDFSVLVPTNPTPEDRVVFAAAALDSKGDFAFMVANPGFPAAGTRELGVVGDPSIWMWAWRTDAIPDNAQLNIDEDMGSGAARVFDFLRYAYYKSTQIYDGKIGKSLVVWLGYGTSWSCGACFAHWPASVLDMPFESQMWIPADSDASYWADPVTAHELGHWVMSSFGTSPNEGGPHSVGVPTFPGQAWSEGFATWFSSDLRNTPLYYDKQGGSMFWADLSERRYSGATWTMPTPGGGLLQKMDENEVSAMLWELREHSSGDVAAMHRAFTSSSMNQAPWRRGYTRHTWEVSGRDHVSVVDTGVSVPFVADYFDALNCAGYSREALEYAAYPHEYYPYPVNNPLCR